MPEIDVFKEQNEFDPVFKVIKKAVKKKKKATNLKNEDGVKVAEKAIDSSEIESVSLDGSSLDDNNNIVKPGNIVSEESLERSDESEEEDEADKLVKL